MEEHCTPHGMPAHSGNVIVARAISQVMACPHLATNLPKTAINCCRSYSRRQRQHCCLKRQHCCRKQRHFVALFGDCSRPIQSPETATNCCRSYSRRKRQHSCRKRRSRRFQQQFVAVFGDFVAVVSNVVASVDRP